MRGERTNEGEEDRVLKKKWNSSKSLLERREVESRGLDNGEMGREVKRGG